MHWNWCHYLPIFKTLTGIFFVWWLLSLWWFFQSLSIIDDVFIKAHSVDYLADYVLCDKIKCLFLFFKKNEGGLFYVLNILQKDDQIPSCNRTKISLNNRTAWVQLVYTMLLLFLAAIIIQICSTQLKKKLP